MKLSAKYIREKLKKKWTVFDFATDLGITEEEFWKLLQKQFPAIYYKEFKSALKANEKHHKRIKDSNIFSSDKVETALTSQEKITCDESDLATEDSLDSDPTLQPLATECIADEVSHTSLEDLLTEYEQICHDINSEELNHKRIVALRAESQKEINSIAERFRAIKKEIDEIWPVINALSSQLAKTKEQLAESSLRTNILYELKDELEAQIERAKTVYIWVYSSGELDVDATSNVTFPAWNDLFTKIVEDDELTSLTIKQAKTLAKVIVFVRELIAQNTPYEICFDEEIAENYFQKAIS